MYSILAAPCFMSKDWLQMGLFLEEGTIDSGN